jgi:hypothetical protein
MTGFGEKLDNHPPTTSKARSMPITSGANTCLPTDTPGETAGATAAATGAATTGSTAPTTDTAPATSEALIPAPISGCPPPGTLAAPACGIRSLAAAARTAEPRRGSR